MPLQNPCGTQSSFTPQVRSPHAAPPSGAADSGRVGGVATSDVVAGGVGLPAHEASTTKIEARKAFGGRTSQGYQLT